MRSVKLMLLGVAAMALAMFLMWLDGRYGGWQWNAACLLTVLGVIAVAAGFFKSD